MTANKLDFIQVKDRFEVYSGANQYWVPNKFHALSGCGPTTASEILAYLAFAYPEECGNAYEYDIHTLNRKDFVPYITSVREFVKPGFKGLTDINFYERQLIAYAQTRGVSLGSKQINREMDAVSAFEEVATVIDKGLPLALLILRNPYPDIDDYTWHWMTVVGYDRRTMSLIITTHGRQHALDFEHVWHQQGSYYSGIVYFWPKDNQQWSMSI